MRIEDLASINLTMPSDSGSPVAGQPQGEGAQPADGDAASLAAAVMEAAAQELSAGDDESDTTEARLDPREIEQLRQRAALAEQWEQRFKGLQGSLQQAIERQRQLEQELMQREALLAQLQIQQLPEEQQALAWQQWQMQQQMRQQQLQQAQAQQFMALLAQAARELANQNLITQLSQQYGVPKHELEEIARDPYAALRKYAERVAQMRRQTRKVERKEREQDRFGGAGAPTAVPQKPPETYAEAREQLRKNFRFVVS